MNPYITLRISRILMIKSKSFKGYRPPLKALFPKKYLNPKQGLFQLFWEKAMSLNWEKNRHFLAILEV